LCNRFNIAAPEAFCVLAFSTHMESACIAAIIGCNSKHLQHSANLISQFLFLSRRVHLSKSRTAMFSRYCIPDTDIDAERRMVPCGNSSPEINYRNVK